MDPNTEELNDPKPKEGATQKYLKNRFVITTPDPVPQMPTQQYKKAEDPKTAKNFERLTAITPGKEENLLAASMGGLMATLFQKQEKARRTFHKTFSTFAA